MITTRWLALGLLLLASGAGAAEPRPVQGRWQEGTALEGWAWTFQPEGKLELEELIGPQARTPRHRQGTWAQQGSQVKVELEAPAEALTLRLSRAGDTLGAVKPRKLQLKRQP